MGQLENVGQGQVGEIGFIRATVLAKLWIVLKSFFK